MAENIGRPDENTFGNQTFSVSQTKNLILNKKTTIVHGETIKQKK